MGLTCTGGVTNALHEGYTLTRIPLRAAGSWGGAQAFSAQPKISCRRRSQASRARILRSMNAPWM
jgi:hypothetical protein